MFLYTPLKVIPTNRIIKMDVIDLPDGSVQVKVYGDDYNVIGAGCHDVSIAFPDRAAFEAMLKSLASGNVVKI